MGWRDNWAMAHQHWQAGRDVEAAPFAQRVLDWMDDNCITYDLYEPGVDDHEMPSMRVMCDLIVSSAKRRGWKAG